MSRRVCKLLNETVYGLIPGPTKMNENNEKDGYYHIIWKTIPSIKEVTYRDVARGNGDGHFSVEIKMNSANSLRKSKLARKGEQMHIKTSSKFTLPGISWLLRGYYHFVQISEEFPILYRGGRCTLMCRKFIHNRAQQWKEIAAQLRSAASAVAEGHRIYNTGLHITYQNFRYWLESMLAIEQKPIILKGEMMLSQNQRLITDNVNLTKMVKTYQGLLKKNVNANIKSKLVELERDLKAKVVQQNNQIEQLESANQRQSEEIQTIRNTLNDSTIANTLLEAEKEGMDRREGRN
ncbi:hypothetical protein ACFE04_026197 [Oxalis oulophora]